MPDLHITYSVTYIHPRWYITKSVGDECRTLPLHFGSRHEAESVAKFLASQKEREWAGTARVGSTQGDAA
jgi:hypothetical protein